MNEMNGELQVVYVLTNPAMPGMVKIGYSTSGDANKRIGELYNTSVPVPFKLEYACRVRNAKEVEQALHEAFAPSRVNPRREFFEIDPGQAIAVLKLLHEEDATDQVNSEPGDEDIKEADVWAAEKLRKRRPQLNFTEMGIPIGSTLLFDDGKTTVEVVGEKKVRYEGAERSLTGATRDILGLDYSIQPTPRWTYKGVPLSDLYEETYGVLD